LTNNDLLTASKQQLDLSRQQLDVAEANFSLGNNTLTDLSPAKSQGATHALNVTTAQNAYDLALLDLKQLVELDPAVEIQLVKPQVDDFENTAHIYSAAQVFEEAAAIYPDLRVAREQALVAEKNIAIARSSYYP